MKFFTIIALVALASCAGGAGTKESQPIAPVVVVPIATADAGAADQNDEAARATDPPPHEGFPPLPTDGKPIGIQAMNISDTARRHQPKVFDGPVRPTKIADGTYGCRISAEYKLRPCTVSRDSAGWAWLEMPQALVGLRGVIYDDGPNTVVFEGAPMDRRPFGCFSCDARCTANPDSCFCKELMVEASKACLEQPAMIRFGRQGPNWVGTLNWDVYSNQYKSVNSAPTGFDRQTQKLAAMIAPKPQP